MYLKNIKNSICVEWIATFGVFILMMQVGIQIGWSSPNVVRLMAEDSDIPIDKDQASWLVSIAQLFGFTGAFIGLPSTVYLGSRATLILAFLFICVSWICMIVAKSVVWLFVGRALSGVMVTLTYSCFSIYLGEIADPQVRGTLISIAAGGNPFGIVIGTVAETYLPRQISSCIYLLSCFSALLLFLWLMDTPYYLVKKGDLEAAKRSVAFYHVGCDLEKKLEEIRNFIETHASSGSFRSKLRDLNSPTTRKSIFIIITLFGLPHISGTMNISSYMEIILRKAKSDLIDSQRFVIYANVTSVISTLLTFRLIDKLGRRFLLIVSSIGTTIAMAGLGTHFYLLQQDVDSSSLEWLPVLCILGYLITYSVGFSPVPSTVLSELFTDNVKSSAALMATLSAPFFAFVVTKSYQPMVDCIGESYVFWIHAVLSFVATPYALFILPETKGKTFQEIQDILQRKTY